MKTSIGLLQRIKQSSCDQAWNRLVEIYRPLLQRWLIAYQVNSADTEDLIQEVLTVLWRELNDFEHNGRTGAFRNWLRKVLVHRVQCYWRERNRNPTDKSVFVELEHLQDNDSPQSQSWNVEHDESVMIRLFDLVRPKFHESTWEAFRLQVVEGKRPAEIAQLLGLSASSVYVARNRVLKALRSEAEGLID